MRKGYLARWERRKNPGENHITDYWFSFTPNRAAVWDTKQEAENDCTAIFNRFGIDILASNGGTYLCRNFVVEERGAREFIVFCEAPFRSLDSSEKSGGRTSSQDL